MRKVQYLLFDFNILNEQGAKSDLQNIYESGTDLTDFLEMFGV